MAECITGDTRCAQLRGARARRAADLNAAFADPSIRAILATIGGEDQITVIPHLEALAVRADPKPFVGYSDNTRILTAGRFAGPPADLDGGVLLVGTSEDLIPAREVGWILRSMGERGLLAAVAGVLVARPPTSDLVRRVFADYS
jgi:muramoyltetrapeptide carboxypeptidase LdcA involved in peptidoglycan recycling